MKIAWSLPLRLALAPISIASAQTAPAITLGWGLDTAISPRGEITRLWIAYLRDHPERVHASPYWSSTEQQRWPDFDLTRRWAYQSQLPTILEVSPATPTDSSAYVIKTLWATARPNGSEIRPIALQRVYARRSVAGWQLENALPRLTAEWDRVPVNPISYHIQPGVPFDTSKALCAAAFVRQLSQRFQVNAPEIDYFIANSPESLARIIGLDWFVPGTQGRAYVENRQVFSGSPTYGPAYLHELVHIVLGPLSPTGVYWLSTEGLATWLGGSLGSDFRALMEQLATFQREHANTTVNDVLAGARGSESAQYATAALLYEIVYERHGDAGVRRLATESGDEAGFRAVVRELLKVDDARLNELWRQTPQAIIANDTRGPSC